jgi:RNA polymerase sigma factor (TIGR02999 family)
MRDGPVPDASTGFDDLIRRADHADRQAGDQLFTLLYQELHRLAEAHLRRAGSLLTMGATTLIHEAYLNITGRDEVTFAGQAGFLAYASRAMRGLIIDYARRRQARKRGQGLEITLPPDEYVSDQDVRSGEELTRLGDALDELATVAPELATLVDLHFFSGFSFAEIATLRGVSERTVQRDWRKARLVLHHALLGGMTNR